MLDWTAKINEWIVEDVDWTVKDVDGIVKVFVLDCGGALSGQGRSTLFRQQSDVDRTVKVCNFAFEWFGLDCEVIWNGLWMCWGGGGGGRGPVPAPTIPET
jgi:hypothetical protein